MKTTKEVRSEPEIKERNISRGYSEALLRGAIASAGYRSIPQIVPDATGLSMRTIYDHMADGDFRRSSIMGLIEALNLGPQDVWDIFFSGRKSTHLEKGQRKTLAPPGATAKKSLADELDEILSGLKENMK